jgi:DNA-binding NtrC family response regulator
MIGNLMIETFTDKKHIKILFVDDDVEFVKSAKQCLKLHGSYEITCAFSVPKALKILEKNKFDAIISDLYMPITDGLEFLKSVRENDNITPFILFTVTEDKQKAVKAFNLGANGFVGKTGDAQTVYSTLKLCIEKAVKVKS